MRVLAPSNFFVFTVALIKCNIIPMAVGSWTAAQRCKHNCVFPHPAWPAISVTVPGLKPPLDVSLHPSARSTPSLNVTKLLLNLLVWSNESVLNFKNTIMYKRKCYILWEPNSDLKYDNKFTSDSSVSESWFPTSKFPIISVIMTNRINFGL